MKLSALSAWFSATLTAALVLRSLLSPRSVKYLRSLLSLRGVIIFFVIYGCVHGVITRLPGPTLALDDVKLAVTTQSWQWGYLPNNPPLYDWLLIATQSVFGPSLLASIVLKYTLMLIAAVVTFFAAREVTGKDVPAGLSAFSLLAFAQIAWNFHETFTHSLAVIVTTLVFCYAVFRLIRAPSLANYAMCGLAIGLGLLSKYSFALVAVCFLLAAIIRPAPRRIVLDWRSLVALAIAAVIVWPHGLWLADQGASRADVLSGVVSSANSVTPQSVDAELGAQITSHLMAGANASWAVFSFLAPLACFVLLSFPASRKLYSFSAEALKSEAVILVRNAVAIGIILVILGAGLIGGEAVQERYVTALFLPVVFLLAGFIAQIPPFPSPMPIPISIPVQIARYTAIIFLIVVSVAAVRTIKAVSPGEPFCHSCRQWTPYEPLARALHDEGFSAGTLVGYSDQTAGNLRRLIADARVISSHMPAYTPPGDRVTPCYFIWSSELSAALDPSLSKILSTLSISIVEAEWKKPFTQEVWRKTSWSFVRLDDNEALARSMCKPEQ